jgi:hypothetical protein
MSLMKIFLLAAFEANSELSYDIPMIRKGSNVSVDEEVNDKGESQFKVKLRNLMEISGQGILDNLDLVNLSNKLLQVVSTMLAV